MCREERSRQKPACDAEFECSANPVAPTGVVDECGRARATAPADAVGAGLAPIMSLPDEQAVRPRSARSGCAAVTVAPAPLVDRPASLTARPRSPALCR